MKIGQEIIMRMVIREFITNEKGNFVRLSALDDVWNRITVPAEYVITGEEIKLINDEGN